MNEQTLQSLETFLTNREEIKSVFRWDSGLIHLICASMYSVKNRSVDVKVLHRCKELLRGKVGAFSNFRGIGRTPIATMMALSEDPQSTLDNGLSVYQLLKKHFWSSTYLPLAAMIIAEMAQPSEYERIAIRTRKIYDAMKVNHPILTSGEDSTFCALMALSEKSDEVLMRDAEECYGILKKKFFSADSVQSLSHVLALCDGAPDVKCKRTMELFNILKEANCKYGTSYELPTLGVLAMSSEDLNESAAKMIEIDHWLARQKGFGFFSGVSAKQRLMYAGILTQREYQSEQTMQTAAINGAISVIVAQQAAMCAAVAASSAAASASASS